MLTPRQKTLLILLGALVIAGAGVALAVSFAAPDAPAQVSEEHAMPTDDRCAHMPEHCGGDAHR